MKCVKRTSQVNYEVVDSSLVQVKVRPLIVASSCPEVSWFSSYKIMPLSHSTLPADTLKRSASVFVNRHDSPWIRLTVLRRILHIERFGSIAIMSMGDLSSSSLPQLNKVIVESNAMRSLVFIYVLTEVEDRWWDPTLLYPKKSDIPLFDATVLKMEA